jgi:hypothetical protein
LNGAGDDRFGGVIASHGIERDDGHAVAFRGAGLGDDSTRGGCTGSHRVQAGRRRGGHRG